VIYRKVALERLSSPEQLDQLLQVTRPRGWLALAAIGAVLVAGLTWGIWGSIPTEAQGEGILQSEGGVSEVVATGSGQVADVLVQVGQKVEKNQVVARIRQEALQRQIKDTRSKQEALLIEYREALASADAQRRLKAREIAQQRANLELSIATLDREVNLLEQRVASDKALLADGLLTKQAVLAGEQALNAKRDQVASQRLELNGLELRLLEAGRQLDQQLEARQSALRDFELQVRELDARLEEDVNVVSPQTGTVIEVLVARGDVVSPGAPVLSLEVQSKQLTAVLFVPAGTGKQVQPGMEARISPTTVKREEYGALLGTVTWVAKYPSTARDMTRKLGNEALVTRLMAEGPPVQINVELERDPATPTGYRWSSSRGPDLKISSGTLAAGGVVVRRERPIRLVIPLLREKLGV
jgi:HlyD family secretion protein